ncbi:MAG: DUF2141 domain-containing protein [Lewinellaceae bacterium]|nr:DUF2141 domain-containing protein [Lewinellaceae bacterium]
MSLICILIGSFLAYVTPQAPVYITGVVPARGQVLVAVYNSKATFLDHEKALYTTVVRAQSKGSLEVSLPDLAEGWHAVSCFQDLNESGELEANFLGIPTEPYGFSNGARPKFRAPTWEEARIWVKPGSKSITIRLEKW